MPKREEIVLVCASHASHYTALTFNQMDLPTSNADDLVPTNEDLGVERNNKNTKPMPKKGAGAELRSPAQPDSRVCMIRTQACSA